ncbi:Crp/Fnr family transcriptional regulator [Flagellimonas sp. CMM7]|uniref:Crp/Fnr family transcriptional regulator n=1 Tax=Flagellimonas sp. CMM7 TaxID=2654676 RepID=UPI0013D5D5A9|nr:Crp/Fnr family transcriptional regulator [Flagellimonas sp. CMM7]UII80328.1 Crp/Fnr family transcriptional regulator [Flagellimonas sp. CMM7]
MSNRLSKKEMIHLCSSLVMEYYKKGDQIRFNRKTPKDVFFLKKGTIKIVQLWDNGDEIVKDIIKTGDIFGIHGLLNVDKIDDYAIAIEDTMVCVIDASTLQNMMGENENLNNYIFKLAGLHIKKLERKLESLLYKDSETRIKEFIIEHIYEFGEEKDGTIITKKLLSDSDIGKLTSTSRQTVNKVLNQMKKEGGIYFDNKIVSMQKRTKNRRSN